MKNLLLYSLLIVTTSAQAVLVQFPKAKIIQKWLINAHFEHFAEKTKLVQQLAEQQKDISGITMAVELALYDYVKIVKNPLITDQVKLRKSALIKCLLQNASKVHKEL